MILTYVIDIDKKVKLNQGQGHKVKGQGHVYVFMQCFASAINHERMDGS